MRPIRLIGLIGPIGLMRPIRLIGPTERHGDYGTSRCGGSPFHANSTGWHGLLKRWNENGAALMDERLSV